MPQSLRDDTPPVGDPFVVVEGRTAEEALEEVHRIHGTEARIVQAEKVRKGGVGGFFTRELVQLTVEPTPTTTDRTEAVAEPLFGPAPAGVPAPPTMAPPAAASPDSRRRTPVPPARAAASARRAAPPTASPAPTAAPEQVAGTGAAPSAPAPASGGLDAIVAGLAADTDRRESTFGDALRAALDDRGIEPDPRPEGTRSEPEPAARLRDRGNTFSSRPREPLFTSGATALAATAERVDAGVRVLPTTEGSEAVHAAREARRSREQVTEELESAETRLDAAVRAAAAGTTAGTVLRAAESGRPTGYAVPRTAPEPQTAPELRTAPETEAQVQPATGSPALPAAWAPTFAHAVPTTRDRIDAREQAPTQGAVATDRWSEDRLARLGVPAVIIRAIVGQRPKDDMSWLTAAARAVAPLVGTAPAGPALLVGRVRDHAQALDVTLCSQSVRPPHSGTIALAGQPTEQVQRWLDRERGGRFLHLVVGGGRWRDWLFEQPAAVAWDRPQDLPDALGVAARFDLPLTGTVVAGRWKQADPTDVAIALRTLLEQR